MKNKIKIILLTCAKNLIDGKVNGTAFSNLGLICIPISLWFYVIFIKLGIDDSTSTWISFLVCICSIFILEYYFNKLLKKNNTKNIKKSNYYPFILILFSILILFIDYVFYKI